MTEIVTLRAERFVAGGAALARCDDGRRALVTGALPGELVAASVRRARRDMVHADTVDVLDASTDRVVPPCPAVALGCGGCSWQHVGPAAQRAGKRDIVTDALRRLGGIPDPPVAEVETLAPWAYRTSLRVAVSGGRVGLRRANSHDVVPLDRCPLAAPAIDAALASVHVEPTVDTAGGHTRRSPEVTLRVVPGRDGVVAVHDPAQAVTVPTAVVVAADRNTPDDPETDLVATVDGHTLRVPVRAFFQPHLDAAAWLAAEVVDALEGHHDRVADLYGGVGLFASFVEADEVLVVEQHPAAARAAAANLAHRDATVVRGDVAATDLGVVDAVVADPSRDGLGRDAVRRIDDSGASTVVLVSCDPAALGRDARLLRDAGFWLETVQPMDQFGQTPHVEVVSRFTR